MWVHLLFQFDSSFCSLYLPLILVPGLVSLYLFLLHSKGIYWALLRVLHLQDSKNRPILLMLHSWAAGSWPTLQHRNEAEEKPLSLLWPASLLRPGLLHMTTSVPLSAVSTWQPHGVNSGVCALIWLCPLWGMQLLKMRNMLVSDAWTTTNAVHGLSCNY